MAFTSGWTREQFRTYFDNASAKRDFRAQLRGSRSVILWTLYLAVILVSSVVAYSHIKYTDAYGSLEQAQANLREFDQVMLMVLGALAAFVATVSGAMGVVLERQRRSLDLVLSAPVSTKYYLVGKLLSSYRLTWMMILLALPALTVGVAMGGGNLQSVFVSCWVLSIDCLIFASIGTAISASVRKPYLALALSLAVTTLVICFAQGASIRNVIDGRVYDNVFALLSPASIATAPLTVTLLFGKVVSSPLLFTLLAIPTCWFISISGGSGLATRTVRETVILRACCLLIAGAASWLLVSYVYHSGSDLVTVFVPISFVLVPILLAMPYLACSGPDGDEKFQDRGKWSPRFMLSASPSASIWYGLSACLIVGASAASAYFFSWKDVPAAQLKGQVENVAPLGALGYLLVFIFWLMCAFTLVWSISRAASRLTSRLQNARAVTVLLLAFMIVPSAIIAQNWPRSLFNPFVAFAPLEMTGALLALGQGMEMLVLSRIVFVVGDRIVRKRQVRELFERGRLSLD